MSSPSLENELASYNASLELTYPPRSIPKEPRTLPTPRSQASTPIPPGDSAIAFEVNDPQTFELAPVDRGRDAW